MLLNVSLLTDTIDWANKNQGIMMVILTFVYGITTYFILKANQKSVEEMKLTREETNRPYVIVYFEREVKGFVHLIIENIGPTMAKQIKVNITPALNTPISMPLSKSYLLNKPIKYMPPKFKYKAYAGDLKDIKKEDGNYNLFEVVISYDSNQTSYEETYELDLNVHKDILMLEDESVRELRNNINELASILKCKD